MLSSHGQSDLWETKVINQQFQPNDKFINVGVLRYLLYVCMPIRI